MAEDGKRDGRKQKRQGSRAELGAVGVGCFQRDQNKDQPRSNGKMGQIAGDRAGGEDRHVPPLRPAQPLSHDAEQKKPEDDHACEHIGHDHAGKPRQAAAGRQRADRTQIGPRPQRAAGRAQDEVDQMRDDQRLRENRRPKPRAPMEGEEEGRVEHRPRPVRLARIERLQIRRRVAVEQRIPIIEGGPAQQERPRQDRERHCKDLSGCAIGHHRPHFTAMPARQARTIPAASAILKYEA
jgi:hypothetical protein